MHLLHQLVLNRHSGQKLLWVNFKMDKQPRNAKFPPWTWSSTPDNNSLPCSMKLMFLLTGSLQDPLDVSIDSSCSALFRQWTLRSTELNSDNAISHAFNQHYLYCNTQTYNIKHNQNSPFNTNIFINKPPYYHYKTILLQKK